MIWVILSALLVWCCLVHVWLAKVRDDLAASRAAADERFRDGFRAGFASAAAVQDAGLSVLRGALR